MSTATRTTAATGTLRDLVALTKPRITLMVVITAAGAMWLALRAGAEPVATSRLLAVVATVAMVVSGANALNCWLERDSDRLMARTASRPLPDGRLAPNWALLLGTALGVSAVPLLWTLANPLTGILGGVALVSYVAVYTPLKRISSLALLIGAVPGALPPLMGWTAVTNELSAPGLVLFAILFAWQIPHFIAISVFRQEDYERAGLKVLPSEGMQGAKIKAALYAGTLLPLSLLLVALRTAGPVFLVISTIANVAFFGMALRGFRTASEDDIAWSRKLFGVSLIHLMALFFALAVDAWWLG